MDSFNVVDPRLAAGRGEQYSAAYRRKKLEEELGEEEYQLPVNQRIEDSLDTEGLKVASTQEAIPESNVGFQMLQRMGWKGQGLGSKEDGITAPVGGGNEASLRLGLGKQEEDDFYTASDNIQRKRLEVEIQADEDETRAAMRELQAEREQRIREDVSTIKRTFYCEVILSPLHLIKFRLSIEQPLQRPSSHQVVIPIRFWLEPETATSKPSSRAHRDSAGRLSGCLRSLTRLCC